MQKIGAIFGIALLATILVAPTIGQQSAEDWVNRGVSSYDAGRYTEAIEYYDKAIKIDPQFVINAMHLIV